MHELSIVAALLETVGHELRAYPDAQVQIVRLRVGQLRLVEPDTLRFCYAAAVTDTPLAGSRLEIEAVSAAARCDACQAEFPVEENWFACPVCQATSGHLLTGQELDLVGIELEESPALRSLAC